MVSVYQRRIDRDKWWSIHDKDSYVCPSCHQTQKEHGKEWQVHHINDMPGKIVGLCKPCHGIRHGAEPRDAHLECWKREFLGKEPLPISD